MNIKFNEYRERFENLTLRERLLVTAALLATLITIGYTGFIEPILKRLKNAEAQYIQQKNELSDIQQKINLTETTSNTQQATNSAILNQTNQQIADAEQQLLKLSLALIAPEKVPDLLKEILKRNSNVELISLRNLPSIPIIENKADDKKNNVASPEVSNNPDSTAQKPNDQLDSMNTLAKPIFKHSVEIIVGGSYGDLLAYLTDLENMPQRLLWNSVELNTEGYPRNKMTIVVYTLSFDKNWLSI